MNCREFQKLIPAFINDTIEDEEIEAFITHSKECEECFDELEIYYMLFEGLDKLEKDAGASFDLKGELQEKIKEYEEHIYTAFKMRIIGGVVSVVAQIILACCVGIRLWNIFM